MARQLWKPKNLSDTIFPITTLSALMGFGVFQCPIGRSRMLLSGLYTSVLSVILWSFFIMIFLETYNRNGTEENRNALLFLSYLNQATTLFAQISSFWHTKKQLRIVDRLMEIDKTLWKLGASFDYQRCLFVGMLSFGSWFSLFLGNAISRISWLTDPMPLGQAILLVVITKYPAMIHMFVGLTFWILAWYTGLKFHAINKLLEEPYKHIYGQFESDDFGNFLQQQFRITSFNNSLCGDLKNDRDRSEFIQIIKHVHLETTLLTKDLNDIYGGLMLVQFGMDFVQFTVFSYVLYGIWVRPQVEFKWIRFNVAFFWMSAFLLKIFLVNGSKNRFKDTHKRRSFGHDLP
ncbi:uncharacterized protein [Venturia canescens]|uniref:uncharacterized protein n=1 Tax=Venturia canescens TaxID=32260 RepID=UPI001C9D2437|nr:uncharacterized protein LOC122416574 [Venturia canescens]